MDEVMSDQFPIVECFDLTDVFLEDEIVNWPDWKKILYDEFRATKAVAHRID